MSAVQGTQPSRSCPSNASMRRREPSTAHEHNGISQRALLGVSNGHALSRTRMVARAKLNCRASRRVCVCHVVVVLAVCLLAALPPTNASRALAQRVDQAVMIIARSTGITDIPSQVLRAAFLGLRPDFKGVHLIPLNIPLHTPIRERLDRKLLGLEQAEVGAFWINQRVRDGRTPPRTIPDIDLAVRVVVQLPGAITCVPSSPTLTVSSRLRRSLSSGSTSGRPTMSSSSSRISGRLRGRRRRACATYSLRSRGHSN